MKHVLRTGVHVFYKGVPCRFTSIVGLYINLLEI